MQEKKLGLNDIEFKTYNQKVRYYKYLAWKLHKGEIKLFNFIEEKK